MYITNMLHFLDENGDIPKKMPKEARELAGFVAMVVDHTTTIDEDSDPNENKLTCMEKGCSGKITTQFLHPNNEIHWKCDSCDFEGVVSHWEGSRWDNFDD